MSTNFHNCFRVVFPTKKSVFVIDTSTSPQLCCYTPCEISICEYAVECVVTANGEDKARNTDCQVGEVCSRFQC